MDSRPPPIDIKTDPSSTSIDLEKKEGEFKTGETSHAVKPEKKSRSALSAIGHTFEKICITWFALLDRPVDYVVRNAEMIALKSVLKHNEDPIEGEKGSIEIKCIGLKIKPKKGSISIEQKKAALKEFINSEHFFYACLSPGKKLKWIENFLNERSPDFDDVKKEFAEKKALYSSPLDL